MTKLLAREINYLGYWDRFCILRGINPYAKNEGEIPDNEAFEFTDDEMDMLRGVKPMPVKAEEEKPLPTWEYDSLSETVGEPGPNDTHSFVAEDVAPEHGELLADAPRMLEALRLLSKESLGDWGYSVRDDAAESGDGWKGDSWSHPRVVSWGLACKLTNELVKKHAGFGK